MPYPPPSRHPSGPRRRALLASVAGAALLVGCTSRPDESDGGTSGSPSLAEKARARAARDSDDLVGRYDAVLAAHPVLASVVGPLRAEALRHAAAFGPGPSAGSPTPSGTPTGGTASPSASPSASVSVPTNERDALADLAAAERALADRRAKALLDVPGELARLLASVAAAGAVHAYLLTEGAK
ncbi:hypothetical protein ACWHLZ_14115 [Streptomyces chartreusis]|uniref:hypothetical protein n=1 Tax=Streptomyces TaxID=1883 RepID=UPI002E80B672|nr:hypothetical protein [Streptomyces chartreusis]WSZ66632.1 hypothetical protein OG938_12610 [Streptomyces chartreusis]WTA30520.1 hypothetical protein OIA45_32800 [Streptomyces chartreusis]WUB21022.1 hypothetical protein OG997_31800 [Streptomyces chartreusis]